MVGVSNQFVPLYIIEKQTKDKTACWIKSEHFPKVLCTLFKYRKTKIIGNIDKVIVFLLQC